MAYDATYIRQFFEAIRDERGYYRNTATRIGTAFLLLLDYLASIDYPYLRKDIDDTAQGRVTFLRGITAHLQSLFEGLTFSDILQSAGATSGFDGQGITMTAADGRIQADALEVRGWMRVAKLVYNMIQVMEQDYQFTGGGDIERVEQNPDGTFTLHIHKEKEGRHTSFADFDILMGKVDDLTPSDPAAASEPAAVPEASASGVGLYTSWLRVCENGVTLNEGMTPDTVRVELWEDAMVPGGRNFPPKAMMTLARRGNTRDAARQSFWELSTTDQRITYYWRVDQPKLRADHYALCLGILPTILDQAGILPDTRDPAMPSLYVNTVFYEHAHHIHYPSRVVKEDRGEWVQNPTAAYTGITGTYGGVQYLQGQTISEPYHCEAFTRNMWLTHRLSPANASLSDEQLLQKMRREWHVDLETSRTWHYGALWECLVEGTTQEPGFSSDWTMVSGLPARMDFIFDRATLVWVDDVTLRAEARILIGTSDVTDDVLQRAAEGSMSLSWAWERLSGEGAVKTASDELWQPTTESGHPNVLLIDHRLNTPGRRQDCGPLWESLMRVVYRCTARMAGTEPVIGELGLG